MDIFSFFNMFFDFNYRWLYPIFFKTNIIGTPVDLPSGRIRFLFNDEYILGSFISRLFPIFLGLTFYYI